MFVTSTVFSVMSGMGCDSFECTVREGMWTTTTVFTVRVELVATASLLNVRCGRECYSYSNYSEERNKVQMI